jgi:RNA polymerase sigma-70 factor (ECF subfamily)
MNGVEKEIIEGCKQKNRHWQEMLYRRFHGKMLAICLRYINDRGTALDIMNRGFLRVFNKIDQYQPTGSLEAWIKVIIVHGITDYFKQQRKIQITYTEQLPEENETWIEQPDQFFKEDLLQALNKLPEAQRVVFNLFAIEGYTHKEIAAITCANENTVRWAYAEAKKKLKKILTHSFHLL